MVSYEGGFSKQINAMESADPVGIESATCDEKIRDVPPSAVLTTPFFGLDGDKPVSRLRCETVFRVVVLP